MKYSVTEHCDDELGRMDVEPCLWFTCSAAPWELRFWLLGMHAHLPGLQRYFPSILRTASWKMRSGPWAFVGAGGALMSLAFYSCSVPYSITPAFHHMVCAAFCRNFEGAEAIFREAGMCSFVQGCSSRFVSEGCGVPFFPLWLTSTWTCTRALPVCSTLIPC